MSYYEIGKKLNMDAKAVDNAVQRARKKLKSL
jgi:DNA-directed RNA polymerase specialized sigma24 family protein